MSVLQYLYVYISISIYSLSLYIYIYIYYAYIYIYIKAEGCFVSALPVVLLTFLYSWPVRELRIWAVRALSWSDSQTTTTTNNDNNNNHSNNNSNNNSDNSIDHTTNSLAQEVVRLRGGSPRSLGTL